jgi:oligosaccharide repeat unit polymerase
VIRRATVIAKTPEARGLWWLNPAIAFSVPALIAGFVAYETGTAEYLHFWRTPKYFDFACFRLLIAVVAMFLCGCLLGSARRAGADDRLTAKSWTLVVPWSYVRMIFTLSFILTVLAYLVWFGIGIKNGLNLQAMLDIIRGASDTNLNTNHFPTIAGVTTATQFGLAVVALGVPLGVEAGWRTVRWQFPILFFLAFVRALLNSERLGFIEILVPFIVSFVWLTPVASRFLRFLVQCAPVMGALALYLFFGASEYFRSWSIYYAASGINFWTFVGLRLMGYYATALNNGALLWRARGALSLHMSLGTVTFLWRFPLLKNAIPILFPSWGFPTFPSTLPDQHYTDLLTTSANLEFNNPSGIYIPFVDYGVAGGLLYWLLCGLVCGYLYKEFKQRTVIGVFLYPAIYISLIEATRILYWSDGRFFPGMFLLVVSVLFVFRRGESRLHRARLLTAPS